MFAVLTAWTTCVFLCRFFTFRLFQMLGVKSLPPNLINGTPSAEDFAHPEYVQVLHMQEL